jgi:excisionase family DNA binding protein
MADDNGTRGEVQQRGSGTWLRVSQVAKKLQIYRNRAYELVGSGELPAKRISRHGIRVREEDVEAWMELQPDA